MSSQAIRELTLSSLCLTLPYGRRGIFSFQNREEDSYPQNLLDNGKDFKISPVFRVPSTGPTTGIQQALKALYKGNCITLQKLLNRFVFLEQPQGMADKQSCYFRGRGSGILERKSMKPVSDFIVRF